MSKKRILASLISISILATSLMGCGQRTSSEDNDENKATTNSQTESVDTTKTSEEESIEQEFEYYTDNKNIIYCEIPESVILDGKTYEVTEEISYKELEQKQYVQKVVDLEIEDLTQIPGTDIYIGKDGKKYVLKYDQVYVEKENAVIKVKVTDTLTYADKISQPSFPNTRTIKYFNKATNQDDTCEGTLVKSYISKPFQWKNTLKIDGVFQAPSADCGLFELAGLPDIIVPQNAETPAWGSYQQDIIKNLALDPNHFRITAASWNGGQYTDSTINKVCRKALFTGDMYVANFSAEYEGMGESLGYKTKVFYRVSLEELGEDVALEDITTVYKIKAIVKYRLVG